MRESNYCGKPAAWGIFHGAFGQGRSEATVRFGANSYNTEEKEEISS